MKKTAFRLAGSTVIVALTMVACTAQSDAMRRLGSASSNEQRQFRQASELHGQALRSLRDGQVSAAISSMEEAVALSPRDAGYRLMLADLYMKNGRFDSARATFADVIELDPSNVRAGLSLALMQVALGRPQAALGHLHDLQGRAAPADLGLAFALAGQPDRAIEILEPAARRFDATPRLRQNLALSYAIAGDWQRARAIASQDVPAAELGPRLQQWAALARPDAASIQVAGLLGVTPVADPGQPVRLALAPPAADPGIRLAEAVPAPVQTHAVHLSAPVPSTAPAEQTVSDWGLPDPAAEAEAVPIAVAAAPVREQESYYLPPQEEVAARSEEEEEVVAAVRSLSRPDPVVVRASAAALPPRPVFRREAPASAQVRRGESAFVVQLGAFSNEGNAERAWQQAEQRFGLDSHVPLTTTISMNGRTLHRVSVAGFASQNDAARMCVQIRRSGGSCFVRPNAGDASVRWAARYAREANRQA